MKIVKLILMITLASTFELSLAIGQKPTQNSNDNPPADPILALRDQIAAADTAQERVPLQLKLVDLLLTKERKQEAINELSSIAASDEFNPQGLYNVGNAFARLGDADRAINCYRKAIEQRKGNYSRAFNNLGVILLRAGRWDEAYEALHSALKIENFRYPEASYNLGRLYAARGDTDLAVREWRRVLSQDPAHAAAREAIARAGTEGRIVVEPSEKIGPPITQSSRPQRKSDSAKSPSTTGASQRPVALKSSSVSPKALNVDQITYDFLQRARSDSERGNTLAALDSFERVIARQGGYFPPADLELSYLLISLKRYDEAMPHLQLVVQRDGRRYPISYFHLARLYELKGDLKQAETLFSQTVAAFGPANPQFLLDLSRVREKQGEFKSALEAMEEYLNKMKERGLTPGWSNERLSALREKLNAPK